MPRRFYIALLALVIAIAGVSCTDEPAPSFEPSPSAAPTAVMSPSESPSPTPEPMSYEEYFSEIRTLKYTDRYYDVDYEKTPFEVVVGEWKVAMYERTLVDREDGRSYGDWYNTYILLNEDEYFDKLIYYLPDDGIYIKDAESAEDIRIFEQQGDTPMHIWFSDDVLMFWDHAIDGECKFYRAYIPTNTVDFMFSFPAEAHHYSHELIEDFETFIACDRPLLCDEEMLSNCEYRISTTCPAYFERKAEEMGMSSEELYRELASHEGYTFEFAMIYNSILDAWWGNETVLSEYDIPPEKQIKT